MRCKTLRRAVVEIGRAQHIARTVAVARLRICRPPVLSAPGRIFRQHQSKLAVRLAVTRRNRTCRAIVRGAREIGAIAGGKRVQEVLQRRLQRAADRGHAKWRERHEVAVVFAAPVDQAIAASVRDQHVATRAAERAVFITGAGVRRVVQRTVG